MTTRRTCEKCGGEKVPICSKAGKPGSGYRCRPCWAAYMREFNKRPDQAAKARARGRRYYRANIDLWRDEQLRRMFGITKADYDAMHAAQGGGCAVCGSERGHRNSALAVDHCHDSGKVRGLLCSHCNQGLGHAKDDPERLRGMASYLERSRGIAPPQISAPAMLWHF